MKLFFTFISMLTILGCNRKPDLSNPKDVVSSYQNFINEGKISEAFDLVSDSSKSILTFQDFQDYYNMEFDSAFKRTSFFIKDIKQMPIDANFPDFRSFEFRELVVNKLTKDSALNYYYVRVKNLKKSGWHVVWTKHLERVAHDLQEDSKFDEAIKVCDKILHYDPLNGDVYLIKAWIYYRLGNITLLEQTGMKGFDLAPNKAQSHITMSVIYDTKGLYESAKLSNQKALLFTSDPEERSQILSNTSVLCEHLNQSDSAIYYLRKAISKVSKTHAFWRLAKIFDTQNKNDSSIYYFDKAIVNKPMGDYLQIQLYCDYADFLVRLAIDLPMGSENQRSMALKAKNFVLKALDLDPNDSDSKLLLDKIKKL